MDSNTPTGSTGSAPARLPFHQSLPLAAILFAFWVVLSGKLDLFHLALGAASALAIAYSSCGLYAVAPSVASRGRHPFVEIPWLRLAGYIGWLAWQILLAAIQIARIVLSPRMKLAPTLVRFDYDLPHNLARATLANSITLTPGTVTLDVRGDEYLVHGLNGEVADDLVRDEPGSMKARVARVFERPVKE